MKTVLVIGAAGFVGPYLINNLRNNGYKVIPTKLISQKSNNDTFVNLDILNKDEVISIFNKYKPEYIVNLAAQASVGLSWKDPVLTFNVNVIGTLNILEAIKSLNFKTRLLLVGTSEEYGHQDKMPISEDAECKPNNFYALSKLTQENIAKIYVKNFGLDVIFTRSFNHIGPGQSLGFVVPDFCKQVVDIEKGLKEPIIYVGNLSAKRDFSDVRDIVEAYRLLLENGETGEIYNIGSGEAISINYILNSILSLSKVKIKIVVDKNKIRPIDNPLIRADISKLHSVLKLNKKRDIQESILLILEWFREK